MTSAEAEVSAGDALGEKKEVELPVDVLLDLRDAASFAAFRLRPVDPALRIAHMPFIGALSGCERSLSRSPELPPRLVRMAIVLPAEDDAAPATVLAWFRGEGPLPSWTVVASFATPAAAMVNPLLRWRVAAVEGPESAPMPFAPDFAPRLWQPSEVAEAALRTAIRMELAAVRGVPTGGKVPPMLLLDLACGGSRDGIFLAEELRLAPRLRGQADTAWRIIACDHCEHHRHKCMQLARGRSVADLVQWVTVDLRAQGALTGTVATFEEQAIALAPGPASKPVSMPSFASSPTSAPLPKTAPVAASVPVTAATSASMAASAESISGTALACVRLCLISRFLFRPLLEELHGLLRARRDRPGGCALAVAMFEGLAACRAYGHPARERDVLGDGEMAHTVADWGGWHVEHDVLAAVADGSGRIIRAFVATIE